MRESACSPCVELKATVFNVHLRIFVFEEFFLPSFLALLTIAVWLTILEMELFFTSAWICLWFRIVCIYCIAIRCTCIVFYCYVSYCYLHALLLNIVQLLSLVCKSKSHLSMATTQSHLPSIRSSLLRVRISEYIPVLRRSWNLVLSW